MANVIQELSVELARVGAMLGNLDEEGRRIAGNLIRYGRQAMALNQYEEMREALDDLKVFGRKD